MDSPFSWVYFRLVPLHWRSPFVLKTSLWTPYPSSHSHSHRRHSMFYRLFFYSQTCGFQIYTHVWHFIHLLIYTAYFLSYQNFESLSNSYHCVNLEFPWFFDIFSYVNPYNFRCLDLHFLFAKKIRNLNLP